MMTITFGFFATAVSARSTVIETNIDEVIFFIWICSSCYKLVNKEFIVGVAFVFMDDYHNFCFNFGQEVTCF